MCISSSVSPLSAGTTWLPLTSSCLLMMADIHNDIIKLQEKVFVEQRGLSLDNPPHSGGEAEFVASSSGRGDLMIST